MRIVIIGCGRVGSTVARLLSPTHDVTIVDRTSDSFRRLGTSFKGKRLVGPATDMDVLRKAGVEGADAFIAVTDGDNRNIMASQMAKRVFNVPTVLKRVYDPVRASVFQKHGIHVLCTTSMAAGFFRDIIEGNACDTFAEQLQAYLDASVQKA